MLVVKDSPGVTVEPGAANVINRTGVEYPQSARANGIEGTVTLEVTLDSSGGVTDARVLAGPNELRRVSLQSVLQWRFAPDVANATRQITIRFDSKIQRADEQAQLKESTPSAEILRRRLAELEREEEVLAKTYTSEHPERVAVEKRLRQTREQLEQELSNQTSTLARRKIDQEQLQAELQELQKQQQSGVNDARVAALKKQLEELRTQVGQARSPGLIGRTMAAIVFDGVSESLKSAVLSKLPLRTGDILTQDSISALMSAVRSVDERLVVTFDLSGANETLVNIFVRQ
jgi:TonB family protein